MLPRIRFPSFSGHYTEKSLHDAVLELKSGLSRMFSDSDIGLPVIRSNNIKDYCLDFNELKYWFEKDTQGATTSNYHLRDGDILVNFINSQAQIGKSAIYYNALNRDCIYTTNILSLRINKEYSPEFIFFFFQTKKYDDYIQSITKPAVNQASFTTKDFRKMKIFFPDLTEQTKIANFLCSVDEKIALLNKQYELLCQYKKGMMQKIFSQEVRFKDENGKDFPEWKQKKIRDITSLIKDGTHGTHNNVTKSDFFLLSAKNIQEGKVAIDKNDRKISEIEFRSIFKNYDLKPGDILLSVVGTIGRVAIYSEQYSNYAFQRSVAFFRFPQEIPEFIYQLFNATKFQKELLTRQVISAQPGIYLGDLADISLEIPVQKEQMKIANVLSALDDKIAAKKTELDKLKTWKQGLLQQMFI